MARAQPWLQLQRKPLPASENILLNYVSPWSIVSLFNSLFAGHFPVTIATIGGILLKVAIVVSTGLFTLEQRRLSYPMNLNLIDSFNMTRKPSEGSDSPMDLAFVLRAVAEAREPYPRGVTSDIAALSVSLNTPDSKPPLGSSVNLTAPVPVFSADIHDCEFFSWSYNNSDRGRKSFSLADIMPPADLEKLSPFCIAFGVSSANSTRPSLTNISSPNRYHGIDIVFKHPDCILPSDIRSLESTEFWIFASIVVDRPNNTSSVSALLCAPRYSITLRQVTSSGGNIISVSSQDLETLNLGELTAVITASLVARLEHTRLSIPSPPGPEDEENTLVQLMNYTTPQDDWRNFADLDTFEPALRRTWKTTSAITAKLDYTVPATSVETVEAIIDFMAGRLVVMPVPLRVVEAILVVLIVALSLLAAFDFKSVKQNSPSLLNSAIALSNSERLEKRMLSDVSPATPQRFGECLDGHLFSSRLDGRRVRVVVDKAWQQHDLLANFSAPGSSRFGHWWLPTAATSWFRISIFATTVVFLVVLEVLSQLSGRNRGIADLTKSTWARYTYNWAPTIAMCGLGLAYVAMDRAVRGLHAFAELSRAHRRSNLDALRFEPNASISPVTLVKALRRQHHGLSALVMCSILAGALTISASGLFVAETVPRSEFVELQPLDWFDVRNASEFGFSAWLSSKSPDAFYNQGIQFHNISAPVGTYGPFAFAALDPNRIRTSSPKSTNAKLRSRVPAVRGQSNCTLYSHQPIVRNVTRSNFEVKVAPPDNCTPGPKEKLSDGKYIYLWANAGQAPHDGFFGFLSDLTWNLLPLAYDNKTGMYSPVNREPYTICADSVQHTWIHYGRYDENARTMHDLTVLHCIPFLEALEVEATFNLPALTVDTSTPPRPVTTPTPWTSPNRTWNSIPFSGPLPFAGTGMNSDSFFSVLTRGIKGVPGNELLGRDKVGAMISKINDVYQELGAVFLHANCRVPLRDGMARIEGRPEPARLIRGEILSFGPGEATVRLVQREVPTRLLEGLLLCMAGLGVLGFWLVGDVKVLPRDPGSVAAQVSLFAGSKLVKRLRNEGGRGLEGEQIFLGWWEPGGGKAARAGPGRRYGIDIMRGDTQVD